MCIFADMKDWDDLRFFLNVARAGNVTAAATLLGVNHSTVSRRIQALETRHGIRLFDRLPTGYALTALASELLNDALEIEKDLMALTRKLESHDSRLTGRLRITAPEGIVAVILLPHIAAFTRQHPGIEIGLSATSDIKSLANREADIAIRVTNHPPAGLFGRKLTGQRAATYASSDYLRRCGFSREGATDDPGWATAPHAWIGLAPAGNAPDWVVSGYPGARCAALLDTVYTLYEAARAGIGIAQLPCRLGDADPVLTRVPPLETQQIRDIWMLYHRDMRRNARLRAFADFLGRRMVEERGLFQGAGPSQG